MTDPSSEIEALTAFEARGPGTDAERRAAGHLAARLRALGREANLQPILIRPNWPIAHMLGAGLAVVGSVLAVIVPAAGVALLLLVAAATLADLSGSVQTLRRITSRRASQNVVSPEHGGKPGVLLLTAHYDAGRSGLVFRPGALRARGWLRRVVRRPVGPFEGLFWSMMVVLACAVLRLGEIDSIVLTTVQFLATAVLVVSVALLADIAMSATVPGAADNASGVAAALALAERHGGRLRHLDVWVVFPGAGEALAAGMREWLRARGHELDPEHTLLVNLDTVANGSVRYARREGLVLGRRLHPVLATVCEEVAAGQGGAGAPAIATPFASTSTSAAHVAGATGMAAVTVSCLDDHDVAAEYHQHSDTAERVDPAALGRAIEFASALIEAIDARIGPGLEPAPPVEERSA